MFGRLNSMTRQSDFRHTSEGTVRNWSTLLHSLMPSSTMKVECSRSHSVSTPKISLQDALF
jgi:hypothetical protein